MKKNIVLIETDGGTGTGILYPCRYEWKEPYTQSFVIFTNKHVLEDIGYEEKIEDVKDYCILHIYDDNGNKVEDEDIKKVQMHVPVQDAYLYHDIAALLVCIADTVSLTPETNIFEEELINREMLFMEGYPGVMLDDAVSQKVQLQGMAKSIFPINEKMGVYQISDDYHWYNDYNDYKLMRGFSGGPVYIERNGKFYLVGMNQSVSDIHSGENPFKLAYYIKAKYILEYLRDTNGIIFRKEKDDSYTIEWIANLREAFSKYENEHTLLLIGGSGAGKSSFALDFAYSKDKIHAINDGQTTRTNVVYEYSLWCERPKATIRFLDKESFARTMAQKLGAHPYIKIWEAVFGIEGNDVKDEMYYIKNCYYFMRKILGSNNEIVNNIEEVLLKDRFDTSKIDKVRDIYEVEPDDAEMIMGIYEEALIIMLNWLPIGLVKFICDKQYLDSFMSHSEKKESDFSDVKKALIKIIDASVDIEFKNLLVEKIVNNILMYFSTKDYRRYQERWSEIIPIYEQLIKDEVLLKQNIEKVCEQNIKQVLVKTLFDINGFFSLQEFGLQDEDIMKEISNINVFRSKGKKGIEIDYSDIYEKTYGILLKKVEQLRNYRKKKGKTGTEVGEIEIDIANMTENEEQLLTQCLQVTKDNKSWTGMIQSIYIQDRISNQYALMLKELKIKRIRILDTCGLDHVSRDSNIMDTLYDIRVRYEMDLGIMPNEYSIVYVKKLDAGKPDELRNIIPQVYKVIPQAPIYCVFTGIDIYYGDRINDVQAINWSERNRRNCPKVVKYIYDNKQALVSGMVCSQDRKENLYRVLKNNLVPFCGSDKLVNEKYAYYENNQKYVRMILSSIMLKEFDCLEIVDTKKLRSYLENGRRAEAFLAMVFRKASEKDWYRMHHSTVTANYKRISGQKEKQLGFWRSFKHQWNQLFEDAYVYVANNYAGDMLCEFEEGRGAVEATILSISSKYLGSINNLLLFEWHDRNLFRLILEDMYKAKNDTDQEYIYQYNPFEDKIDASEFGDIQKRREYMKDVNNFEKGYDGNAEIRRRFVEFFIDTLIEALNNSNKYKTRNLITVDKNFTEALDNLIDIFDEKYGMDEGKVRLFKSFVEYHIKRRKEGKESKES